MVNKLLWQKANSFNGKTIGFSIAVQRQKRLYAQTSKV